MLLPVLRALLSKRDDMLELPLTGAKERQDAVYKIDRASYARRPISDGAVCDLQVARKRRLPLTSVERHARYFQDVFPFAHFRVLGKKPVSSKPRKGRFRQVSDVTQREHREMESSGIRYDRVHHLFAVASGPENDKTIGFIEESAE